MHKGLKIVTGIAAAASSLVAAATPALARPYGWHGHGGGYGRGWHGGYRHYGDGGLALGAGVLGFALGAAVASDRPYRDRAYYEPRPYGYYGPPRGYYYGGGYYGRPTCWTRWAWDPYYGGRVPVQVCR